MEVHAGGREVRAPIALVLDRPHRAGLAVLTPVGSPAWTLTTVGTVASVLDVRGQRQFLSADADTVLGDVFGVDAETLWGLVVGDPAVLPPIPLPGPVNGTAIGDKPLPGGRSLRVLAEAADGRPVRIVAMDAQGAPRAAVHYGPFSVHDGVGLPTTVDVEVPDLDLTVRFAFDRWDVPTPLPDVFGLAPPDGFHTLPLSDLGGLIPR